MPQFTVETGLPVFFAHPQNPCQRGLGRDPGSIFGDRAARVRQPLVDLGDVLLDVRRPLGQPRKSVLAALWLVQPGLGGGSTPERAPRRP